jgi:hypothetical protein
VSSEENVLLYNLFIGYALSDIIASAAIKCKAERCYREPVVMKGDTSSFVCDVITYGERCSQYDKRLCMSKVNDGSVLDKMYTLTSN